MSLRASQPFRSLTDKVAGTNDSATPPPSARHVLAQDDSGAWTAALLLSWQRRNNTWWGRVAMLEHGEAAVYDLIASRLRPATCECCSRPSRR